MLDKFLAVVKDVNKANERKSKKEIFLIPSHSQARKKYRLKSLSL